MVSSFLHVHEANIAFMLSLWRLAIFVGVVFALLNLFRNLRDVRIKLAYLPYSTGLDLLKLDLNCAL